MQKYLKDNEHQICASTEATMLGKDVRHYPRLQRWTFLLAVKIIGDRINTCFSRPILYTQSGPAQSGNKSINFFFESIFLVTCSMPRRPGNFVHILDIGHDLGDFGCNDVNDTLGCVSATTNHRLLPFLNVLCSLFPIGVWLMVFD